MAETTVKMSAMAADTTVEGTEKLLALDGTTSKTITTAKMAEYAIDVLVAAAEATPTSGDDLLAVRAGAEKRLDLDAVGSYIVGAAFDSAAITTLASGDLLLAEQASGGARKVITAANLTTSILTGVQATVLNLSGLGAATLAASDLFAVCQTTTPKKVTLANLEVKLWADFAVYVAALDPVATTAANDKFYCIQGGVAKYVTPAELATYFGLEGGDVVGPGATTIENKIPQWSATDHELKDGLSLVTEVRTVGGGAEDTAVPTEQAVREMMDEGPDLTALDAIASIADADLVLIDDGASGTNTKGTFTQIWAWIWGKIKALGTKATPVDADILIVQDSADSDTLKEVTVAQLWDNRYILDAKAIKLDDFAAADDNTDLDVSTGGHGLCPKLPGGTSTFLRGDGTFASPSASVDVDNIDLDGGTDIGAALADADLILVDDGAGGTNRKSALSRVWTYIASKFTSLSAKVLPVDADYLPLVDSEDSNALKKVSVAEMNSSAWTYIEPRIPSTDPAGRWGQVDTDRYTATPASTSRITCSNTADFAVGIPLKYTYGSVSYYGIVKAISEGSYIDVIGAPLNTGSDLQALYVGTPEAVCQIDFFITGTYGDGTADLLSADMATYFKWQGPKGYLVAFSAAQETADTGAEPKINVKVNTAAVSTADTNKGIQLSTSGTWVDNGDVSINTSNYDINRGEAIEIACTEAGGTGDAENLTVSCIFVME